MVKTARTRMVSLLAAILAALILSMTFTPGSAEAMNPPQRTVQGTVNQLYWKLDQFWRWALKGNPNYTSPRVGYYDGSTYFRPSCGTLSQFHIMAYCNAPREIWVHVGVNQSKINRLGDYAAGFFLAHEFGHHVANVLRKPFSSVQARELYADCMAGVFTRWARMANVLDNADYWEGEWSLGDFYPAEGGANGYPLKSARKAWYRYGYTSYNLASCGQLR